MSFAGFVFDMIRRDKENRNLRLLRRERLNERLDKMHKGCGMPHNTTAEDMEKITRFTHYMYRMKTTSNKLITNIL